MDAEQTLSVSDDQITAVDEIASADLHAESVCHGGHIISWANDRVDAPAMASLN
jgi:hypothetical protein